MKNNITKYISNGQLIYNIIYIYTNNTCITTTNIVSVGTHRATFSVTVQRQITYAFNYI